MNRILHFFLPLLMLSACADRNGEPEKDNNPAATVRELSAARGLFVEHGCAGCHGESGAGDGPFGEEVRVKDLRIESSYVNGTNPDQISRSIREGIAGSAMQPYHHLPEREIRLMASYVHTLLKR